MGCKCDLGVPVCRMKAVFKPGPTLHSLLTKVKDPLPIEKQANIVYEVPCTCGKVYFGETTHQLKTRLNEHKDACIKGFVDKSAIAEHAWTEDHPICWGDTRILHLASRTMDLLSNQYMDGTSKLELQSRRQLRHTRLLDCRTKA